MTYEIGQIYAYARMWNWAMLQHSEGVEEFAQKYWDHKAEKASASLGTPVVFEEHSHEFDGDIFISRRVLVAREG